MQVKIKKLHPLAKTPTYATDGSGAFDLYSCEAGYGNAHYTFDIGIAFEIPPGYAMFILSRSGHGFNHGTRLANCVGLIDSDYRQAVKVKLASDGAYMMEVKVGDRIAQGGIPPLPKVRFLEVEELSETPRLGGFGSSGS